MLAFVFIKSWVFLEKEDSFLEFFPGARLNYAENVLRRNDDAIAITAIRETGSVVHYTRRQLRSMVCNINNSLKFYDVKPHDRVADTEILYTGKRNDLCQKIEESSRDLTSKYGLQYSPLPYQIHTRSIESQRVFVGS
ncbi:hypothetical protein Clacol_010249 [Clathrus columnatus]|uniref:Uncharacterized protein n=1 Tax=Clathrus columnatus TaxID=1419009 RepID=A0AAV5AVR2_9AGAM|nr:hypothetical protein Clacol_010249 [Clathrus columnatus]